MGAIFFIYTATISLGLMARLIFSDCGNAVTNPRYPTCPINLTIAIDFSIAMENETNIENLLNFVLVNFTNRLPFNDSKFYISLLSFGTKNGIKIYDYVQSYEEFCGQVYKELENLKSDGSVEVRLFDVLLKYWKFISNGQDMNKIKCDSPIACTNKLALFTAIGDETNMKESANISDVINSYGRIAAVGINQPVNDNLFRIGWTTYGRVLFDNYNLWPENPLEPFLNTLLCAMNVKNSGDYRKCGEAYCEEVSCSYHGIRSCYFLAGCVNGHCLYWDMLAYYRYGAQSQCQNINSTLVVVYDKTFQEGLYKIAGDFEYWIDLTPTDSNSNWKWSDVNLTLEQTNYTNWANNKTSTTTEIDLCVTDTNSKNLVHGWKVVPCNGTSELDNMTLGNFRPYICSKAASSLPNTDTTPSDTNHMFEIIAISALFIASLILLFILFAIGRYYYRKHKEKQNLIHNKRDFYIDLSTNNLSNGVFNNNLKKLLEDENVNTITFSSDPQEKYDFNILDLDESGTIEANTRHLVRKFLHKPSGKIMAVKYLRIPHSRNDDEAMDLQFKIIQREIESFQILSENPNIIDFYGLCIHQGLALLCMELMDLSLRGLYRLVYKEEDSLFPEKIVGCVFVKIIDALIFCKSKGIMHRDIKPSNILINYSGEIKLCDFGESRIVENSVASTQAGTLAYWPPERFSHGFKYDVRGDIWSLGITLMETILGQLPYLKIHQTASNEAGEAVNFESVFILQQLLCNTDFINIIDDYIRPDYSDDFCETLNLCTQQVKERPKPGQLMMTRFYEQYVNVHSFEIATEIAKFKK